MREARIIFPAEGKNTIEVRECIHQIKIAFGGATVTDGFGYWLHPNGEHVQEIVRIADIAYEPTQENDAKLYDLAWTFRKNAEQIAVYLRYGNGHVQMVTMNSCMDNGEFDLVKSIGHDIDEDGELSRSEYTDEQC